MKCAPVRRAASHADQAGARERACTIETPSARTRAASRPALRQIASGFLVSSPRVKCRPPARSTDAINGPPALATNGMPPASATASVISTVVRSDPAGAERGQHLQDDRAAIVGVRDCCHPARYIMRSNGEQAVTTENETTGRLDRGDGVTLAWAKLAGRGPTVVFLPGYRSDMTGDKANALAAHCAANGQALLRLDYSGHGKSGGRFEDGTVGRWAEDAMTVIQAKTTGPLVLVGSSMGGWIALLASRLLAPRLAGLIGIAAAPDFTELLMWDAMSLGERTDLMEHGALTVPSQYGESYQITRALIEDGRNQLLLGEPIDLDCKVRLLHGQRDPDVPWETALRIAEQMASEDVRVILVKDGDHRLSRPSDLSLLCATLAEILGEDGC